MKILHIGKFYPPYHGGMEHYLCDLAEAQARQHHQVVVWVHNHQWGKLYSRTSQQQQKGVHIHRQAAMRPILFAPLMLRFGAQLKRFLQNSPDVLHLHWPNPSLVMLLFNKRAKKLPWVISWHSDMVTSHSSWLMKLIYRCAKPFENRLLKHAQSIVVSSQAYADHSPQLQQHRDKVTVLPLGIDVNKMNEPVPSDEPLHWPPKQFRLFHLGRLTFYKNQSMLIAAMAQLPDMHLNLAGSGQLEADLKTQVAALEAANVTLLGGVSWSTAQQLYAQCDVFCMASHDRAESFGVVLLEAMYHNKVILVPDTVGSGMRWLAERYNKGFVYAVNDQSDFIEKVRAIQHNYQEIMSRPADFPYDINQTAQDMQHIYQQLLTGDRHENHHP